MMRSSDGGVPIKGGMMPSSEIRWVAIVALFQPLLRGNIKDYTSLVISTVLQRALSG